MTKYTIVKKPSDRKSLNNGFDSEDWKMNGEAMRIR